LIRVVLDANVLISGLISGQGPPGRIMDAWIDGRFRLYISPPIFEEIRRILDYPRIAGRIGKRQVHGLLENLRGEGEWVAGELHLEVLTRDRSDNKYLACAVEAGCDFLVTGNRDHFEEAGKNY
jgi:putative PIN family toxin of toxin-antitoxin system